MKTTVNLYDFRDAFQKVRPNNFSYEGLEILFNAIEETEEETNQEFDLDVIALCCEFSEMTELEIRDAYGLEDHQSSTEFLNNNTWVIGATDKTVIFRQF